MATVVSALIRRLPPNLTDDKRAIAVEIHDFVKNAIKFGFTKKFDEATAQETMQAGFGHCNAKTTLFVDMLRRAGIECAVQFFTIGPAILRNTGLDDKLSDKLSHSVTLLRYGPSEPWITLDSYIVDDGLRKGVLPLLESQGQLMGYGVHAIGTGQWDGVSDSFSQLADKESMVLSDDGVWESVASFIGSSSMYKHKMGPINLTTFYEYVPSIFVDVDEQFRTVNKQLEMLRRD